MTRVKKVGALTAATGLVAVYDEPETRHGGRNGDDPNVFGYNAHAHPEVSTGTTLLISYTVNSFVNTDLYADASIYEPLFIDVTFADMGY